MARPFGARRVSRTVAAPAKTVLFLPLEVALIGDLAATFRVKDGTIRDDPALLARGEATAAFEEALLRRCKETEDSRALQAHEILLGVTAELRRPCRDRSGRRRARRFVLELRRTFAALAGGRELAFEPRDVHLDAFIRGDLFDESRAELRRCRRGGRPRRPRAMSRLGAAPRRWPHRRDPRRRTSSSRSAPPLRR